MEKSLNGEFLRMQKLAGIENKSNDILLETIFEYYLYQNYYSKGILKENLSEGVFSNLKDKVKKKFENFKPSEKLLTLLFGKLRTYFEDEKDFKKGINDFYNTFDPLDPKNKPSENDIEKFLSKDQLNELAITSQAKRSAIAGLFFLIWGISFALKIAPNKVKEIVDNSAPIEQTIKTNPDLDSDPNTADFKSALDNEASELKVSDETQKIIDTAITGGDTNPVTTSDDVDGSKIIKIGYENGEYKVTDKAKVVNDVVNQILDQIPEGETLDSLDITYKGNISNTPGQGDDNPNGPGKDGLAKFRNAVGDDLKDDIEKELKKSDKIDKDAKITFTDGGTNIDDTGDEVEVNSSEAKENQNTSFKIDFKTKDKPKPENPEGPEDALWFLKPRNVQSEGNKFEALIAYILPDIIQEKEYNTFTEEFSKAANKKAPKSSTDRNTLGSFTNFKNLTKELLENAINSNEFSSDTKQILKWVLDVGNEPKSIGVFLNSLDPEMPEIPGNLSHSNPTSTDQGGSMYSQLLAKTDGLGNSALGSVDTTLGLSSQGVSPSGTNPKTGKKLEEFKLSNLYEILLTEASVGDFTSLPGYDGGKAKDNLGRLVLLYTWIWGVQYPTKEDDNVDNISKRNAVAYVLDPKNDYGKAISELDNLYPIIYTKITDDLEKPKDPKEPKKPKEPNKPEPEEPTPPPVRIKKDVENISKFNRNGQIGFVLSRTSPKLNIYSELGEPNVINFSDTTLNNIIKGDYKGKPTSDKAKKLARLIMNLRKSPDSLTKKYSGILGITLKPRAKAIATRPGKDTQAQLQKLQEIKNRTLLYLNEAMIDDIFNELGVSDDEIKNKKVQLLALLGSMYASEEDTTLSILDTNQLSDEEKNDLKDIGFIPQPGGNYVFLGKGGTMKSIGFDRLSKKNKTQPDIDRISKTLSGRKNLQSLLKRIDTVEEFKDLILSIFNQNTEFLDPEFKKDKNKIRSVFASLKSRIQEAELRDVSATVKAILDDSTLKSQLEKINTVEEAIQLILRDIIPYLGPNLINDKTKLKNAIVSTVNTYVANQNKTTSATQTKSSGTTSSTGTTNFKYNLKENKIMKKQIISEEFKRMQKLAGVINENDALDLKSQMEKFDSSSAPKVNPSISWHYRIDPKNQKLFLEKIKNLIISNDEVADTITSAWGSLIRKGVQNWDLNNWKNISDFIMNKFPNLKNQLYQGENNKWPIEDLFKRNK